MSDLKLGVFVRVVRDGGHRQRRLGLVYELREADAGAQVGLWFQDMGTDTSRLEWFSESQVVVVPGEMHEAAGGYWFRARDSDN